MQLPMDYLKDVPRTVTVPVALHLVKDALQPGEPSLAGVLGWYQPDNDTTIKAGEAYGTVNHFTLRDVLSEATELGYSQVREIIRLARDVYSCTPKQSILDRALKPGCIVDAEVFMPFSALSPNEKLYYRLAVLVVNAYLGDDTHNWACEYMSYLGSNYANQYADKNWRMYEKANKADEVVERLLDEGVELDINAEYQEYQAPKTDRLLNTAVAMSIFDPSEYAKCLYLDDELTTLVSEIVFSLVDSQAGVFLDWEMYDQIHPFDPNDVVYHWDDSDDEFPVDDETDSYR